MVQFPVWHETSSSSSFSNTVAVSPPTFAVHQSVGDFPFLVLHIGVFLSSFAPYLARHIVTNIPFFRDRCGHRHRRRRRESKHVKGFGTRESVVSPPSLPTLAWLFPPAAVPIPRFPKLHTLPKTSLCTTPAEERHSFTQLRQKGGRRKI